MSEPFDWPNDQLEALHACNMVSEMFDNFVLEASFVEEDKALYERAEKVGLAIVELYQAIGNSPPASPGDNESAE